LKGKLLVKLTKVNARDAESWLNLNEKDAVVQVKDGPNGKKPWSIHTKPSATILNHEDEIKLVKHKKRFP